MQTGVLGVILSSIPGQGFKYLIHLYCLMLRWFLRHRFWTTLWNLSLNIWS